MTTRAPAGGHSDILSDGSEPPGQVILHHGDPAYDQRSRRRDEPPSLPPAESLFLRIVSYLAFAETVCIPARYVLTSATTFDAVTLAEPLLELGLLRPERRAEAGSFEDVAHALRLGEAAQRRGAWLDEKARRPRAFHSLQLGEVYRTILHDDLAPVRADDGRPGALRRALRPKQRRDAEHGLDAAYEAYVLLDDRTPEAFIGVVEQHAPALTHTARQWAMARYYLTPTEFDTLNTRELPRSAADLLVRGGVLDPTIVSADIAPPAEAMYGRLSYGIEAHDVRSRAREYCDAVVAVRERLPEARRIFADITRRAELGAASTDLADLMRDELRRQQGVRGSSGNVYTLVTGLLASGAGYVATGSIHPHDVLGVDHEVIAGSASVLGGAAGALAANAGLNRLNDRRDRRAKPWVVAIDSMEQRVSGGR